MKWLWPLALLCCGCAARIVPPAAVARPVNVYVVDYGEHTGLFLPGPGRAMVEYSFGDWDYMATNHRDACHAVAALFWSRKATLSRRYVATARMESLGPRALRFAVEADRAQRLRHELDDRFAHDADVEILYNRRDRIWCVADPELYWLGHNCNHVTAGWLRELGCGIEGTPLTSKFTLAADRSAPRSPRCATGPAGTN